MKIGKYEFPDNLYYDSTHNWAKVSGEGVTQGMTSLGQALAGEIIYVEAASIGRKVKQGQPILSLESGKWVGRVNAAVSGEIIAFNKTLDAKPELVNHSPYADGWLVRIRPDSLDADLARLLKADSEAYKRLVDEARQRYGL